MKKHLLAACIASMAALCGANSAAAATAGIPVTVTGSVSEACTTSSAAAGVTFAFGDVVARSAAVTKNADIKVTCSSGASYTLSTTDTGPATSDYTADVGAATGAAKVALTISQATAAANTACTPADFPKTGNTCGAPAGSQKISLTTMAARAGTGSEETLSIFATLSDAANATKAPSTAGEVSVASANLYVVY